MRHPQTVSYVIRDDNHEAIGAGLVALGMLAGAYTGGRIAGKPGIATGALVGGLLGVLAMGRVRAVTFILEPHGRLGIRCELCA